MRAWEPQRFGGKLETPKAWEAFKCYRDLGAERTLKKAAEVYYGTAANLRQIQEWSSKYEWVDRARAFDDYHEMIRQDAVEGYERDCAADYAARREELRVLNFENEERAARQVVRVLEQIEKTPLVSSRATRMEEGRAVEYVIESAVGPMDLAAQRLHKIAKGSEPEKLALTDPSGEHERGKSAEEIDREFEEAFGTFDDGDEASEPS